MTRRYYVAQIPMAGGLARLDGAEGVHATRVMRVKLDDTITLFDGRGHEATASIVQLDRNACDCQCQPAVAIDREPTVSLELGIALPKPERAKEMIERLTELGVQAVTPLVTERSQRPPTASQLDKLRRVVIEACKQSERNVLMRINDPQTSQQFAAGEHLGQCLLLDRTGALLLSDAGIDDSPCVAVVGAEGGWTSAEIDRFEHAGFQSICLGKRIYRIETAAVAIAARRLAD